MKITKEKINRNYYLVSCITHVKGVSPIQKQVYVEIVPSQLRKIDKSISLKDYLRDQVDAYLKEIGWAGREDYFLMLRKGLPERLEKIEAMRG